ncbi:MAG: hypothetical protein OSB34_09080, partial [Planktomarina sp.]|nr:hypothetical protein [Planktomarina sp.]
MIVVDDKNNDTTDTTTKHAIAHDTAIDADGSDTKGSTGVSLSTAKENTFYSITIIDAAIKTVNIERSELVA